MSTTLSALLQPAPADLRRVRPARRAGPVETRLASEVGALLDAETQPAATFRIVPVTARTGAHIEAGDQVIRMDPLADDAGELCAVAAAACTLGPALEQRIAQLFASRKGSLALALDAAANELLFRLADRTFAAINREARSAGWQAGSELSPGDPGMALTDQAAVLALADAARVGVTLAGAGSLAPTRSLTLVVALGHGLNPRAWAQRCDACPSRNRCRSK